MSIWRLMWMEIIHRKLTFLIAGLAILVSVAYAVSSLTLIRAQRHRTEQQVAALDDEIRKITKAMGFNINILPSEQNLADFHANDFAEKTMPYEYVQILANSPQILSVRHLRPALIHKLEWPEYERQIILMGVSGVVPLSHVPNPQPLADPVPAGELHLGSEVARQLNLTVGEEVLLKQRPFRVGKIYEQRGNKDDITVWVDLVAAQELLDLPDQINLIQALECNCATLDRLAQIDQEISQVLGSDVQVIELSTQAIARARAREDVKAEGQRTLTRMQRRATIHLLLLTLAGSILVGLLALANVRERRVEIGVLRALGVSTTKIMGLFLSKALIIGLLGAGLGYALGFLAAWRIDQQSVEDGIQLTIPILFNKNVLIAVLLLTPTLTTLASWIAAVLAASQDPATILAQE
jgi:ABC-type lipoprotein release transport system permease subunit